MPAPSKKPPRLTPLESIEVDDSEDARMVGSAAPELLGAVEAYRAGNHQAALARFFEVTRDSLRSAVPKQLAQLYAAKALIGLELPHASWMLLDAIARDPHHALRLRALPWLGLLASHIDTDAVLESLVAYKPSERAALTRQKTALRERLAYLFGRKAFLNGDGSAAALLEEVGPNAPDYAKALFMLGVVHVRAKRPEAALQTFDGVMKALARPGVEEPDRLRAIATMARARVLFEQGQEQPAKLQQALDLYATARRFKSVGPDAQVEMAWAWLHLERADKALEVLNAARPLLRSRHAEVDGLEVMVHLKRCALDEAERTLQAARTRHAKIQAQIEVMLAGDVASAVPTTVALSAGRRDARTLTEQILTTAAQRTRLARILRRFAAIRQEQKRANELPLDFKQSAAGRQVTQLVSDAFDRTDKAVAEHLVAELTELGEITAGYLKSYDKLATELTALRQSGC